MNVFIQQRHVNLIKSDSKDVKFLQIVQSND